MAKSTQSAAMYQMNSYHSSSTICASNSPMYNVISYHDVVVSNFYLSREHSIVKECST